MASFAVRPRPDREAPRLYGFMGDSWGIHGEVQLRNLLRQLRWNQVIAVRQNDDRQVSFRKPLDRRAEAHRLPVMSHAGMTLIRIQKPAETVSGRCPVRLNY